MKIIFLNGVLRIKMPVSEKIWKPFPKHITLLKSKKDCLSCYTCGPALHSLLLELSIRIRAKITWSNHLIYCGFVMQIYHTCYRPSQVFHPPPSQILPVLKPPRSPLTLLPRLPPPPPPPRPPPPPPPPSLPLCLPSQHPSPQTLSPSRTQGFWISAQTTRVKMVVSALS